MYSHQQEAAPYGNFTLVSYVPDQLGRVIEQLRQSIPGDAYAQAHITLVPPRPLKVPLQEVSDFVEATVSRFHSFEVVLGDVQCFPETNVLYLDLIHGQDEIHMLHDALNEGVLKHQERFEFRPHLTIGGPLLDSETILLQQVVREVWLPKLEVKRFRVTEIVALWRNFSNTNPEWTKIWERSLASANGQTS